MNILNSGRFSVGCAAAGAFKKVLGECIILSCFYPFVDKGPLAPVNSATLKVTNPYTWAAGIVLKPR